MKAIRIEEYGGPETLRLGNLELPDPGPGEVHVKLCAAGLNFVDVYLSRREYPSTLPFTPDYDGAGIIDAVGEGVKEFKPGDQASVLVQLGLLQPGGLPVVGAEGVRSVLDRSIRLNELIRRAKGR